MKKRLASILSLTCPQCGGVTEYLNGHNLLRCRHCHTRLLIVGHQHIAQFYVEPVITQSQARALAHQRVIQHGSVAPALSQKAQVSYCELVFVPLLEVQDKNVQIVRRRLSGGPHKLRIGYDGYDTSLYFTEVYQLVPLIYKPDWGMDNLLMDQSAWGVNGPLRRGDIRPFNPLELKKRARVIEAPADEESLKARYKSLAEKLYSRTRTVKPIERRFRILYYPLWVLRYSFGRSSFPLVLDAIQGTTLYALAPQKERYRPLFAVLPPFIGGVLAATLVKVTPLSALQLGAELAVRRPYVSACVLLFVLAILVSILAFAWIEFRYRGLVEFSPRGARVVKINKPPETFLERLESGLWQGLGYVIESMAETRGARVRL